ncbi:MAG TPA: hypothetical protein VF814_11185 [Casimicrobiaceae bacterium]
MREALLFVHPTFGVFGMLAALWVFVEAYRLDERRLSHMRLASVLVAVFFVLTWFSGGLWDAFFYDADREVMNKGAWAFIGNTTMEMKEHLFVLPFLLGLYLPILAFATNLKHEAATRLPTMTVAGLIVLLGLAMEGAGATLAGAVHVGVSTLLGS